MGTLAGVEEPVARWIKPSKVLQYIALALLLGAVALNVLRFGNEGRDAQLQRDMKVIAPQLERGEMVTVPTPLYFDYKLQGYYYRGCRVSLGDQERHRHLIAADDVADTTYIEVPLPTEEYRLYRLLEE